MRVQTLFTGLVLFRFRPSGRRPCLPFGPPSRCCPRQAGTPAATHTAGRSVALRPSRAFTLIEILVAAGITALLAGFIAGIIHNVTGTWKRRSGRPATDSQARLILD